MVNRLPFVVSGVLLFLATGPFPGLRAVYAADPDFCKPYAWAALVQVHAALASPRCGADLLGTRWSTEFPVHYEWCLGVSVAAAGAERDARAQLLRACADR
jgi:hypothetical protein